MPKVITFTSTILHKMFAVNKICLDIYQTDFGFQPLLADNINGTPGKEGKGDPKGELASIEQVGE